jgi:hypothetical protein
VKVGLLTAGALAQLFGIVLVAAPDLFPPALRFAAWLRPRLLRIVNRVRSLFGLAPRGVHHIGAGAGFIGIVGVSATGTVGVSADASDERKIAFLLEQAESAQQRLNLVEHRLRTLEEEHLPMKLEELRHGLEAHVNAAIAESDATYRTARQLGALCLTFGLGLTTWAAFV